jgi:RNA polymerase sigma-70 factor (ECF subfamily)
MLTLDQPMPEYLDAGGIPEDDSSSTSEPSVYEDWSPLVERIQAGDPDGMAELYRVFSRGIRFYLCRQLGAQELDDKVHDTFLIVVQAIQRGELREPARLMGFVRTIVRRQVASYIESAVQTRRDVAEIESGISVVDAKRNPEEKVIGKQEVALMVEILRSMPERDRDILTRFYLNEQPQEQICEDMNLTDTQFRLLKSRAKAKFGEMGRKQLKKKTFAAFFVRTIAGAGH